MDTNTTKTPGLNVLLNPEQLLSTNTLGIDQLWGILIFSCGTGFAIVISELLEANAWRNASVWVRVVGTIAITFIATLIVTIVASSVNRSITQFIERVRSKQTNDD